MSRGGDLIFAKISKENTLFAVHEKGNHKINFQSCSAKTKFHSNVLSKMLENGTEPHLEENKAKIKSCFRFTFRRFTAHVCVLHVFVPVCLCLCVCTRGDVCVSVSVFRG